MFYSLYTESYSTELNLKQFQVNITTQNSVTYMASEF